MSMPFCFSFQSCYVRTIESCHTITQVTQLIAVNINRSPNGPQIRSRVAAPSSAPREHVDQSMLEAHYLDPIVKQIIVN